MKQIFILAMMLACSVSMGNAQNSDTSRKVFDKGDADVLIYQQITSNVDTSECQRQLIINASKLKETPEKDVFILQGNSFQIKDLRSDIYLKKTESEYVPIFSSKYPMESANNILMNTLKQNHHIIVFRHHQYGNVIRKGEVKMQSLFNMFGRYMELYCNITKIDKNHIEAYLVMHNRKMDFIHMLVLNIPLSQLFMDNGSFTAELYTNIPQGNIKSIYRNK